MINFDKLSETTARKIFYEVVRTIYNNAEILEYIKSGKAEYFGFDSKEELWEDRILFRFNKYVEFICCIDYIYTEDDVKRAEKIHYLLVKLRTLFQDWKDEKVLEEVREFIKTFNNL